MESLLTITPPKAQPMQTVIQITCFADASTRVDLPHNAVLLPLLVFSAIILGRAFIPLTVRKPVSWEWNLLADSRHGSLEIINGEPSCSLAVDVTTWRLATEHVGRL